MRGPAAGLLAAIAGAAVTALAPASARAAGPAITHELYKLEPQDKGCRVYFLVDNQDKQAFQTFKLDLIFFRKDGIIDRRLALDLAPLRASKRSVKSFDIESPSCDAIGSILINDVLSCTAGSGEIPDCLDRLAVSSRASAQVTK